MSSETWKGLREMISEKVHSFLSLFVGKVSSITSLIFRCQCYPKNIYSSLKPSCHIRFTDGFLQCVLEVSMLFLYTSMNQRKFFQNGTQCKGQIRKNGLLFQTCFIFLDFSTFNPALMLKMMHKISN